MKIIIIFQNITGNRPGNAGPRGNGLPSIVDTRGSTVTTSGSGISLSIANNEGNTNNNKGRQLFDGKIQS